MEVILNVSTYISALINPSVFSGGYLIIATGISARVMVLHVQPMFLYFTLLLTALVAIVVKGVFLGLLIIGHLDSYCGSTLRSCGFDCRVLAQSWFARVFLFAGDFPVLVASLLSLAFKAGPYKKSLSAVERYWAWLVLNYFALAGVAIAANSYVNFVYLLLSFIWAIVGTYRNKEFSYLVLCALTCGVSVLNIFAFYVEELVLKSVLELDTAESSGLDYVSVPLIPSDILMVFLLYTSIKTFQLSWYRAKVHYHLPENPFANLGSPPRSPLPVEQQDDDSEESIASPGTSIRLDSGRRWSWYKALGFLFFLLRVLVTLWIVHFMSLVGLLQMFWLFKSVVVADSSKSIKEIPKYLLPSFAIQTLVDYILTIVDVAPMSQWGFQQLENPQIEVTFMLFTISLCFLCYSLNATAERALLRQNTTSVSSLAITILLQNSDKAALCILFGVGLSKINVLHTGLIALCLLFALKPKTAKNHWILLVAYTILLIAIPYVWILLLNLVNPQWDWWIETATCIGVPTTPDYTRVAYVLPPDYLSWCLLLAVSMQLSAYRSMDYVLRFRDLSLGRVSRTYALILKCLTKVFRLVVEMQVWVVYFLLLFVMMLSELNILNYWRFIHVLSFIVLHLHCGNESISRGYEKVKRIWVSIAYFSGTLLVVRYIYQFRIYYKGDLPFEWYLQFVGLKIYAPATFYEAMVGDVAIFVISVFTAKSFHTENRIAQATIYSGESDSYSGEGGVLYELLRADFGVRSTSEQHYHAVMQVLAEPFSKVLLLSVAILAFYWRLSGVMWLMLTIAGFYMMLESAHQHYLVRISIA